MKSLLKSSEEFIFHCRFEKGLSEKTISAYETDLTQFFGLLMKEFKITALEEVQKDHIKEHLRQLQGSFKVKTVKRKVATIKAFFNFLEMEDKILSSPMRKLRIKIKEPIVLPVFLTIGEVQSFLSTAQNAVQSENDKGGYAYKSNLRDLAVLELLFATGIRVSELCNLTSDNINLESGWVKVKGKGNKERIVNLCHAETLQILSEYHHLFQEQIEISNIFFINRLGAKLSTQSVRILIKKYAGLAGVRKRVTPHTFRHTFATLLMEEGVDIKYIQHFLGHSNINTTQIYTHVTSRKSEEILLAKHPRGRMEVRMSDN